MVRQAHSALRARVALAAKSRSAREGRRETNVHPVARHAQPLAICPGFRRARERLPAAGELWSRPPRFRPTQRPAHGADQLHGLVFRRDRSRTARAAFASAPGARGRNPWPRRSATGRSRRFGASPPCLLERVEQVVHVVRRSAGAAPRGERQARLADPPSSRRRTESLQRMRRRASGSRRTRWSSACSTGLRRREPEPAPALKHRSHRAAGDVARAGYNPVLEGELACVPRENQVIDSGDLGAGRAELHDFAVALEICRCRRRWVGCRTLSTRAQRDTTIGRARG